MADEELRKDKPWLYATDVLREQGLLDDGAFIPGEYMFGLLDVSIDKEKLYTVEELKKLSFKRMSGFERLSKHLLEEYYICLRNNRGNGYDVLAPSDQVDFAMSSHEKDMRKIHIKALERTTFLRRDKLTIGDASKLSDFQAVLSGNQLIKEKRRKQIEQRKLGQGEET